jgi:hypothetical protein
MDWIMVGLEDSTQRTSWSSGLIGVKIFCKCLKDSPRLPRAVSRS